MRTTTEHRKVYAVGNFQIGQVKERWKHVSTELNRHGDCDIRRSASHLFNTVVFLSVEALIVCEIGRYVQSRYFLLKLHLRLPSQDSEERNAVLETPFQT